MRGWTLVPLAEVLDAQPLLRRGLLGEVHADDVLDARIATLGTQLALLAHGPQALTKRWWSAMADQNFEAAAAAAKAACVANVTGGACSAGAQRLARRSAG